MGIIGNSDYCVLNTYNRYPLYFIRGNGCLLFADDGNQYLDLGAGIAVSTLGHFNPRLAAAIEMQAKRLIHTSNLYYTKPYTDLAIKLVTQTVFDKVFFCNSGAEANEAAIKLARKHGKITGGDNKYEIVTMKNSFHGRTLAALSATGQTKYQKGFEPLVPGFKYAALNNKKELEDTINENTCAVMLELIQGEGGIRLIDKAYYEYVRELCDKYHALLIIDEVQTGVGRTGKLFAYEHYLPVNPDVITIAKGLGGGMPIGAMLLKEKFAGSLGPGEHASTFGGNLICCQAANVVLDEIKEKNLLSHTQQAGEYFKKKLNELKKKYKIIKEIRGLGLMLGMELDIPASEMIDKLMDKCILAIPAGKNIVRFLPPLIITKQNIDDALNALDEILKTYTK